MLTGLAGSAASLAGGGLIFPCGAIGTTGTSPFGKQHKRLSGEHCSAGICLLDMQDNFPQMLSILQKSIVQHHKASRVSSSWNDGYSKIDTLRLGRCNTLRTSCGRPFQRRSSKDTNLSLTCIRNRIGTGRLSRLCQTESSNSTKTFHWRAEIGQMGKWHTKTAQWLDHICQLDMQHKSCSRDYSEA